MCIEYKLDALLIFLHTIAEKCVSFQKTVYKVCNLLYDTTRILNLNHLQASMEESDESPPQAYEVSVY